MLLDFISLGLITNFVIIFIGVVFWIMVVINMSEFERIKLSEYAKEDSNSSMLSVINYFIPFYMVYLIIVEIYLFKKYFKFDAESIRFMIKELDRYRLFKRFK